MKRIAVLTVIALCCACAAFPQSSKLIRQLENRRTVLQRQIDDSQKLLTRTDRDVNSQLGNLAVLSGQIREQKRLIEMIQKDMERLSIEITEQEYRLKKLEKELAEKKLKYNASARYLYKNRSIQDKLLFIFSAKTLEQTYRRLRYVQEYARYQRLQGEEVIGKQKEVEQKRRELLSVREAKSGLLAQGEKEKQKLETMEKSQQQLVEGLKKKKGQIQRTLQARKREASQLNARIDQLIAEEIEKARKRAEEERLAAERKAAEENKSKRNTAAKSRKEVAPMDRFKVSRADLALSDNFAANRGRLPIPLSGRYLIVSHYGQYNVQGLRNVTLDNKGVDIQGEQGAEALAVFNGKVAAVFKLNGLFNILVRHGQYISVYCNLSATRVKTGDEVRTRQPLGDVYTDGANGGRTVLHFQLRREKEKLNPEQWLMR